MNDVVGLILSFAVAMLTLNLIIIRFEINKLEEDIKHLTEENDNDILGNNTNNIGSNSRDTNKCE